MIFTRSLKREFTQSAAGIFVALFAILISTQAIRLLNDAAGGKLNAESVFALLCFSALNYLPVLLSLTIFISVLLCLSRAYRDSEMVVWFTAGLPLTAWLRPVLSFAWPIVLMVALLSLFLLPWATTQNNAYRARLDLRQDASVITPGLFREVQNGARVIFVENIATDLGYFKNIFISSRQNGIMGVVMAATGREEIASNGDHFMVLEHGRRYEVTPSELQYRIMDFERYAVRTQIKTPLQDRVEPRTMSLPVLLQDKSPVARAELMWRIGLPLSALTLVLLAIPLAFINPRAGRSGNLIIAILVYAIYNNLLSIVQSFITTERLSFVDSWLLHVTALLLLLLMLNYQLYPRRRWQFNFWPARQPQH